MRKTMAKASRSIGLDDAGGRPPGTPEGPYVTDRTDDSRQRKAKHERAEHSPSEPSQASPPDAPDLASRRKGPAQP
jgi:hypothetical protein